MKFLNLENRRLLSIAGPDAEGFLQGLVTQDINLLEEGSCLLSCLLSPQGRFLADFFLYRYQDKIIIDIDQVFYEEFLKKLKLYRLKADILIEEVEGGVLLLPVRSLGDEILKQVQDDNSSHSVILNLFQDLIPQEQIIIVKDPRKKDFSYRILYFASLPNIEIEEDSIEKYHKLRINENVIDGAFDLTIDKSIILEFGYQDMNAINFDKGCFLGQELMTRTHRTGELRKACYQILVEADSESLNGNEILFEGKKIGNICFLIKDKERQIGFALVKKELAKNLKRKDDFLII